MWKAHSQIFLQENKNFINHPRGISEAKLLPQSPQKCSDAGHGGLRRNILEARVAAT